MKRGKLLVGLLLAVSVAVAGIEVYDAARTRTAPFPNANMNGTIAWAPGGATDSMSRTISLCARPFLGTNIVLQNKTGASGAIATEYVHHQPADGYSLLFHAENPALYGVMDLSKIDYDDFYPVLLMGTQTAVVVVPPDSPYESITDLIADAKARPNTLKIGITGAGGLPFDVAAMLESTSKVAFNQIAFDGDAAVVTALMGGHVDLSVVNDSAAVELARAGRIRVLTAMGSEPTGSFPDVEAIGAVLPAYEKYFPWGAFMGVFVRDDCTDEVKETLVEAFRGAFLTDRFQQFLKDNFIAPMGTSGEEARAYIDTWQRVSAWLLEDAGAATVSPKDLGIERIEGAAE